MNELERLLVSRIDADGPLAFSDFMDAALYDPELGFYASGGQAGRRGDFVTSPEVGPLFGAVIANALDLWWHELGRPDPYTVIDAGAGPGTLARSVLAAAPACRDALHYVAVEISAVQRAEHPDDVESRAELPTEPIVGVVLANELLDNLPFDLVAADGSPILVGHDDDGLALLPPTTPDRPDAVEARAWLGRVFEMVERGRVVVIDYTDRDRPRDSWLRTYRGHETGTDPLLHPGRQDITIDVPVDQLSSVRPADAESTQADWLRRHGLDELVAEGHRIWDERAHIGDLEALRARSRVSEAEALTDLDGLGGFRVMEWAVSAA